MNTVPDQGTSAGRSAQSTDVKVDDLRGYLARGWLFERKIFDNARDEEASMRGTASFKPTLHNGADALQYREAGELELGDLTLATEREYLYAFVTPSLAEVRFADGRFFHVLDLTKGIVRVEHVCGEDTYHGLFRILSDQAWLSVWRVMGPRKSQVITTHYIVP